jgi:DNA-binding MarR family transcriptional regulator
LCRALIALSSLGTRLERAAEAYRHRLNRQLEAAGFADHRFPDALISRLCRDGGAVTISQLGRELSMTRQGASKLVTGLSARGYVTIERSAEDAREKVIRPTEQARARLAAAGKARRELDAHLRILLGDEAFRALGALAALLAGPEEADADADSADATEFEPDPQTDGVSPPTPRRSIAEIASD